MMTMLTIFKAEEIYSGGNKFGLNLLGQSV